MAVIASTCSVKFTRTENSAVCVNHRWVDVTIGSPPCLHHYREIRKVWWIKYVSHLLPWLRCDAENIPCGADQGVRVLVHLSLWIMSIHPSGTGALYNKSVHDHTSPAVEEASPLITELKMSYESCPFGLLLYVCGGAQVHLAEISLKGERNVRGEWRQKKRDIYGCFFFLVHPCEGVCSLHCYANPAHAAGSGWVWLDV